MFLYFPLSVGVGKGRCWEAEALIDETNEIFLSYLGRKLE